MTEDFSNRIYKLWLSDRVADGTLTMPTGRLLYESTSRPLDTVERRWTGRFATTPVSLAEIAMFLGRSPAPALCGYDPQKLLPDGRSFEDKFLEYIGRQLNVTPQQLSQPWRTERIFPTAAYDEFDKFYPELAAEDDRRMAGFVNPRIRPGDPEKEPIRWKKAVVIVGGGDISGMIAALHADPVIRAIHIDIDYADMELNQLARMTAMDIFIDGDRKHLAGMVDMNAKPTVSTARGNRDMSYLKHDPSKRNRRKRK